MMSFKDVYFKVRLKTYTQEDNQVQLSTMKASRFYLHSEKIFCTGNIHWLISLK